MNEPLPDFGLKIKLARIAKRMRQDEFAKIIEQSAPLISQWENNKRKPNIVQIWKLCWALEIPVSDIIPSL